MDIHSDKPHNKHIVNSAGQLVEYQTTTDRLQYILDRNGFVIGWGHVANPPRGDGWECAVRTFDHRTIWTRVSYMPRQELAVAS